MSPAATATKAPTTTEPTRARRSRNAGKRAEIEQWLTDAGVEWQYVPAVPLSEFDIDAGLRNQARLLEQIDESVVEDYVEGLKRGDQFPAVVAARPTKRGKLVICDGNHRLVSHDRFDHRPIDTYEITKATKAQIVALTFEANARHGKASSFEDRIHQALWLVDNGSTQAEAAARVNIRVSELTKAWGRITADRRADEVGLVRREWEALGQAVRTRLLSVLTDEGFAASAKLAYRAKLDSTETHDLVMLVNQARSSTKQVGIVKNIEPQYADRISDNSAGMNTRQRGRGPKQILYMALGQFNALPEDLNGLTTHFKPQERPEAAKRARDAAGRLISFAEKLEK